MERENRYRSMGATGLVEQLRSFYHDVAETQSLLGDLQTMQEMASACLTAAATIKRLMVKAEAFDAIDVQAVSIDRVMSDRPTRAFEWRVIHGELPIVKRGGSLLVAFQNVMAEVKEKTDGT